MKPSSRDKIIADLDKAVVLAGAADYDSAMAQFGKLLHWVQEHYHPMRSKSDLSALLDAMPEPSRVGMSFILGCLRFMPQIVRHFLKRTVEEIEDDSTKFPRGRPGLDAYSKVEIVAHVGKRYTAGYTLDQAKKSAAKRFKMSEATVQRAWDDRGNRDAVDFRSVLKYLSSGDETNFLEPSDEQG